METTKQQRRAIMTQVASRSMYNEFCTQDIMGMVKANERLDLPFEVVEAVLQSALTKLHIEGQKLTYNTNTCFFKWIRG